MGTSNDNSTVDGKTGAASQSRSKAGDQGAPEDQSDNRNFIETHNVTKVARKAAPGAGEESADLLRDDELQDGTAGRPQRGT